MRKLQAIVCLFILVLSLSGCTSKEETPANPYLGSNKLDGNGIPPDFFQDVHIRRAIAYCFDWQPIVDDVYMGEAVQSRSLVLPGMSGYDANAPFYTNDLEKCASEFKLADVDKDGIPAGEDSDDVWSVGFRFQMLYNAGNSSRQTIAEVLQTNLSSVNDKFVVEVLGLPWPAFLAAQQAYRIPIFVAGWQEDIHDPQNWYQIFTIGPNGKSQSLPEELEDRFQALIEQGVSITDPVERQAVYQQLNQLYFEEAAGLPLVTATSHIFEQKWVRGRIVNPIYPNVYYKTISKAENAKNPDTFTFLTYQGGPVTFDPALAYDNASNEVIQNVYETLVFYDGEKAGEFVPLLAESWQISDDGRVYTFKIKDVVRFHEGGELTASDVAYSLQRGLLQGGTISPQLLFAEPFLGVGIYDISTIVEDGAYADDRKGMQAADTAALAAACERVQTAIQADDQTGTVTLTLAQPWSPLLATLANTWGSIMDKEWVVENGGWDGSCETWQNFYAPNAENDPFSKITNGTGPFKLDYWKEGEEVGLVRNEDYRDGPVGLEHVLIKAVGEFGTRFSMLQEGDADAIVVPAAYRTQVDPLVGEMVLYNPSTGLFDPGLPVCKVDLNKRGVERFTPCEETLAEDSDQPSQPLRVYLGQPGLYMDVILFNFDIK